MVQSNKEKNSTLYNKISTCSGGIWILVIRKNGGCHPIDVPADLESWRCFRFFFFFGGVFSSVSAHMIWKKNGNTINCSACLA